ncbi:MAG: choice-of-anchor J domain-containing protein, partial [Bacteroidia bacterium]|nr:choice-of-anchor J domain-containing protein [Bacteroidia bacterium]
MRKLYDFFRKGRPQALIMLALLLQFPLWQNARGDGKIELKRNTAFWDTHQVTPRMSQSQLTYLFNKETNTSGNTWNSTGLNSATEKPSMERSRIEWFETFEGNDFPPAGWSIYSNAATSTNWVASTQNNHTPTGSKSAFHNYGSPGVNLENWLITPSLTIPQSNLIVLKFWSFNIDPSYYESNSVWISTSNNNPASGSFSQIWTTPTVQASWVETTIDLTSYAGSTIYLAFRYQGIYAHGWFVDDVLVSSNVDPSPIIVVSPTSIARNLPQGQSATRIITVGNLGMETLNYSTSITYGSGASGWLSLNPSTGSVAGGQTAQITATFDASGLAQGTYEAQIAINSNAPANPQVLVNATLNVVPPSSAELTVIADFYFFPTGISDDGTKVSIAPFGGGGGLYWSAQSGLTPLPSNTLSAYGISNSGLIVGTFTNPDLLYNGQPVETAGRWDPVTNTWSFLGINPAVPQPNFSYYNDGWGISADGNTVVGMQWYSGSSVKAFKWTPAGGYDNSFGNAHPMNNRPNGVNRGGNVIFGWAQTDMAPRSPAIWNNGELILPASSQYGEATCASPSGNYVAGNIGSQGFIWSPANGITTFDNTLNTGNISCLTMLDDGTIFGFIVEGWPPFIDNRRAFVRHPDGQMEFFNEYAMTRGFADAAEWTFFSINAVTPNGNTFVGAGNSPENQFQTFVLSFGSTTGSPNIAVNPTSISKTLQPGQTGTQALTISNSGAAPLNYTLTVTTTARGTSAVETPREGYNLPMGSDRMNPTDAATPAEPVIKPLDTPIYRNMTQGFEDITLLPGLGWALTNNSSPLGTTGWFQGNPTVFPAHAGPETSYIGANY